MKQLAITYERNDRRGIFREYWNDKLPWRSINAGVMKKGAVMGNHYHKKCLAAFFILSGEAEMFIKDVRAKSRPIRVKLTPTEGTLIHPYETHTIRFLKNSTFLLMKSVKFDPKRDDLYLAKLL